VNSRFAGDSLAVQDRVETEIRVRNNNCRVVTTIGRRAIGEINSVRGSYLKNND
jgi:hypothetical protein